MPIEKGHEWGRAGALPPHAPVFSNDADLAAWAVQHPGSTVAVTAGDLARTLGVGVRFNPSRASHIVPIDLLRVELDDGRVEHAIGHVRIGTWLIGSRVTYVMNAAWCGDLNVGPRAHPGDGRADLIDLHLDRRAQIQARRRMRTGTHIPHPQVGVRRADTLEVVRDRPLSVAVDGQHIGRARNVQITVQDAQVYLAV